MPRKRVLQQDANSPAIIELRAYSETTVAAAAAASRLATPCAVNDREPSGETGRDNSVRGKEWGDCSVRCWLKRDAREGSGGSTSRDTSRDTSRGRESEVLLFLLTLRHQCLDQCYSCCEVLCVVLCIVKL